MYKIIDMWLTPNKWSRPQRENKVKYIIIHWTGVKNGGYQGVFNFFEGRKNGLNDFGSAHEMVDNNIVARYIPSNEMAYHVGASKYTKLKYDLMGETYSNSISYGIECRVEDMKGNINPETYDTLVERVADLLKEHNLDISKVLLHGELTGKDCHKLFVENPQLWKEFKGEVNDKLKGEISLEKSTMKLNLFGKDVVVEGYLIDDKFQAPLRDIFEQINCEVNWTPELTTIRPK